MDGWLKQSTAITLRVGPFLDDTDGKTAETALTITQAEVRLSKAGGDFGQKTEATSLVHDELGYYICLLDATDTATLGMLKLAVYESGALPIWHTWMVVPANVWDSLFGADKLQVHATEITDGLIVAATLGADAITAAKVAADVHAEAADAVWDELVTGHDGAGKAGQQLWTDVDAILVDTGTDGVVIPQAQADKVWGTAARALTDKADFALSAASRAAIWDEAGSLSLSFEVLLQRLYQMINNKMIVTEATGAVALRNLADSADIATGNVQDLGATTQRNGLSWV